MLDTLQNGEPGQEATAASERLRKPTRPSVPFAPHRNAVQEIHGQEAARDEPRDGSRHHDAATQRLQAVGDDAHRRGLPVEIELPVNLLGQLVDGARQVEGQLKLQGDAESGTVGRPEACARQGPGQGRHAPG